MILKKKKKSKNLKIVDTLKKYLNFSSYLHTSKPPDNLVLTVPLGQRQRRGCDILSLRDMTPQFSSKMNFSF